MRNLCKTLNLVTAIVLVLLCATWPPLPVIADGSTMVDPLLFTKLKEGQQDRYLLGLWTVHYGPSETGHVLRN
jgi:hypothetical protein